MQRLEELKKRIKEELPEYEARKNAMLEEEAKRAIDWIVNQFERLLEANSPVDNLILHYGYDREKCKYQLWYQDYDNMKYYKFVIKYWRPDFMHVLKKVAEEQNLKIWDYGEKSCVQVVLFW